MVKKLTFKSWLNSGLLILFCLIPGTWALLRYGPHALVALSGGVPWLNESMGNIYGMSAFGLLMVIIGLFILVKQFTSSVSRLVKRYLTEHPEVTMEQLDSEFAAARKIENVWVGRRWTFSHHLRFIVVDNENIAWVHSRRERNKNGTSYYLCLGMADGKTDEVKMSHGSLSEIMELYEKYPHIVVGNNPEYEYQFKHDREAFLNMKYRQGKD